MDLWENLKFILKWSNDTHANKYIPVSLLNPQQSHFSPYFHHPLIIPILYRGRICTIDVKNVFTFFFILVTFCTFLTFFKFYLPNVFYLKKRWQSSQRQADEQEALSK